MYANNQIHKLFTLIESIQGSADDVDSGALSALRTEVANLQARDQVLVKGSHEHRHGESTYLFLVPKGAVFAEEDFERLLVEEFEPDKDEFLTTETVDEPTVVE
jgi:hypothetical protein